MIVYDVVRAALVLFLIFLLIRLVMEWVFAFARDYRPHGVMAMALEVAYTVTDPPYRLLRRAIPPLRLGSFGIDIAFTVLLLIVIILLSVIP